MDVPGMSVDTLTLENGFWRTHESSTEILQCLNVDHCKGGNDTAAQCANGYTGPLCAVCDSGYAAVGSGETLSCNECTGSSTTSIVAGVSIIVLILAVVVLFYFKKEKIETRLRGSSIGSMVESASNKFQKVGPIIKVVFAYFQVVGGLSFVFGMRFPPIYSTVTGMFGGLFSFDFISFIPLGCMTTMNFYNSLLVYTITPILISIVMAVCYKLVRDSEKEKEDEKKNKIFEAFLIMTFVILPTVSVKVRPATHRARFCQEFIVFLHFFLLTTQNAHLDK